MLAGLTRGSPCVFYYPLQFKKLSWWQVLNPIGNKFMESETRPKPTGAVTLLHQTVKLTRTADVDEVTGAVTYSAWSTGEWPSYVVPSVPGYTPSRAAVASAMVDAATLDQTVTITYAREQAVKGNQPAQPAVPASGKPQEAAGSNAAGAHPADQPARLPQTGDQTNPVGVIGWSLFGLMTLLGLKRKRQDEGE